MYRYFVTFRNPSTNRCEQIAETHARDEEDAIRKAVERYPELIGHRVAGKIVPANGGLVVKEE